MEALGLQRGQYVMKFNSRKLLDGFTETFAIGEEVKLTWLRALDKLDRLGKEGVLGRYSIHFHLVRDTMRGASVIGASIWDSGNRWITIHGTDYLVVRDCVGYGSIGHGFFLEDGTEVFNVLDRNLAVQSFKARPLPKQVLPFDPNDGAGFWWANSLNAFTRVLGSTPAFSSRRSRVYLSRSTVPMRCWARQTLAT